MISVASTIKNHLAHAFFFCALGDQFADFTRERNLAVIRNGSQRLYRRLLLALLCLWQDSFRLLGRSAALTLSALLLLLTFSGRFSSPRPSRPCLYRRRAEPRLQAQSLLQQLLPGLVPRFLWTPQPGSASAA